MALMFASCSMFLHAFVINLSLGPKCSLKQPVELIKVSPVTLLHKVSLSVAVVITDVFPKK